MAGQNLCAGMVTGLCGLPVRRHLWPSVAWRGLADGRDLYIYIYIYIHIVPIFEYDIGTKFLVSQCDGHEAVFSNTHRYFRLAIELSMKCPIVCGGLQLKTSETFNNTYDWLRSLCTLLLFMRRTTEDDGRPTTTDDETTGTNDRRRRTTTTTDNDDDDIYIFVHSHMYIYNVVSRLKKGPPPPTLSQK